MTNECPICKETINPCNDTCDKEKCEIEYQIQINIKTISLLMSEYNMNIYYDIKKVMNIEEKNKELRKKAQTL